MRQRERRFVTIGLLANGLAALLPCPAGRAWAMSPLPPERIVALDWTATAMLLSLGVSPVGVGDADVYRIWVNEPALPSGTPDVGLRDTPNLEIVAALKPDLILTSPIGGAARPLLDRIAPTREIALQGEGGDALAHAERELSALGRLLRREAQAADVIAASHFLFETLRVKLARSAARKFIVVQFLDSRFVRVYGRSSLPGSALDRLGLANAWAQPVNGWGFSLVGIEKLARFADADIMVVDPLPSDVSLTPDGGSLWGNLPAVRQGRVHRLPAVWTFGEVTAANRFAGLLAQKLLAGDADALL